MVAAIDEVGRRKLVLDELGEIGLGVEGLFTMHD